MKKFTEKNMERLLKEDKYIDFCRQAQATDFYFHVMPDEEYTDITLVHLVPVDYFDEEKCSWDQSMDLDHLLPPQRFVEGTEMVWECSEAQDIVEEWMISQGFRKNTEFSEMIIDGYT